MRGTFLLCGIDAGAPSSCSSIQSSHQHSPRVRFQTQSVEARLGAARPRRKGLCIPLPRCMTRKRKIQTRQRSIDSVNVFEAQMKSHEPKSGRHRAEPRSHRVTLEHMTFDVTHDPHPSGEERLKPLWVADDAHAGGVTNRLRRGGGANNNSSSDGNASRGSSMCIGRRGSRLALDAGIPSSVEAEASPLRPSVVKACARAKQHLKGDDNSLRRSECYSVQLVRQRIPREAKFRLQQLARLDLRQSVPSFAYQARGSSGQWSDGATERTAGTHRLPRLHHNSRMRSSSRRVV